MSIEDRIIEAVNKVKEIGFDPMKTAFVIAIHAVIKQPKPESKLELYKRWGWSKDIALLAFKREPHCMLLSEEKITKAMDFFVNKMGRSAADIARYPLVLSFSLEKRIIPRCSVFQILLAKGSLKKDLSPSTLLKYSERYFLEKFVIKFQDDIPQLLDVYWGKTNLLEIGS